MPFEYLSAVLAQGGSESDGSSDLWIIVGVMLLVALVFFLPSKSKGKSAGSPAKTGTNALTAESVVAQLFQPTKFQEGYDQDEVDDFLARAVQELRRLENERLQLQKADILRQDVPVTTPVLTPEDVVNQRFQPTKFRAGYSQNEVDDCLDRIARGLREQVSENEQLRRRLGPSQYGTTTTPS